jgi:anaerobic C4-dicarboxylate transporter DcuB
MPAAVQGDSVSRRLKRLVIAALVAALVAVGGPALHVIPTPHASAATTSTSSSATTNTTSSSSSTTTTTAAPAPSSSSATSSTATEPAAEEKEEPSSSDWVQIAVEGLLVIAFIAIGVRAGGIGLGVWGGIGTIVLVFGFGLDPGEAPVSAILIIVSVITAAAAMQAAGGVDYMVQIASRALRARPRAINYAAPYVSYVLTILTGTSNTFFSIIPVINEVAYANKIRPERPLAGSTVASAVGITSSPVAAATATILPLVEVYHYNLVDVLLITIPASIVGIFAMALVMSHHGRDLEDDDEYKRRVEAGEVKPPEAGAEIELKPYAKRSVAIFLGAVLVICVFGLFEELRPVVAAEDGGVEPLSVTPIIEMVMLGAAALILWLSKVKAADVPGTAIFKSGMVAMIALFGIAWMADTFIAANEEAIVTALGNLAEQWPFMIAIAIFLVAGLTTSQSAATRTMVPIGLALGIDAGYMIAMWTAVAGVLFLPANGTQIAAAEADSTGTTTLGKRVLDHSFQLPLQVAWIVTALVGIGIVAVFH